MRDATGRGLGRPRRLFVLFLSLEHPRVVVVPVETGEILAGRGGKCEGHALVAVRLEKNPNLAVFPIVHDVLPAVRRYLNM